MKEVVCSGGECRSLPSSGNKKKQKRKRKGRGEY